MLEHCREGETNCWFYILGVFPSEGIPKVMKDVNVHFLIHSFTEISLIQQSLSIMSWNSENISKLLRKLCNKQLLLPYTESFYVMYINLNFRRLSFGWCTS